MVLKGYLENSCQDIYFNNAGQLILNEIVFIIRFLVGLYLIVRWTTVTEGWQLRSEEVVL